MSIDVDITKHFKGFTLQVRFQSPQGVLGILGASGCGKSITLQCIAGIETPDEGHIVVNGKTLFSAKDKINLKPQQRRVGYLFQNYALFPHLTVCQNIACGVPGSKEEKQRVAREMLASYQLEGLGQRLPGQLSGGQQQRVALARIFASRPEVLLLDEPFTALDTYLKETLQLQMMENLKNYTGDVVLVTHSRDEVYNLCENLLILQEGKALVQNGTKALFKNPRYTQAARLTGCKNFSRARQKGVDTVYAEDWDLLLRVEGPIPAALTNIGIRAHNFIPSGDTAAINYLPAVPQKCVESPFEWNVLFTHAAAKQKTEPIWWKCAKPNFPPEMPKGFVVKPKDILLLED